MSGGINSLQSPMILRHNGFRMIVASVWEDERKWVPRENSEMARLTNGQKP
jgi:hypothetical protein